MNFRKSKLYKTIITGSPDAVMRSLWEYLKSGKDVNLRDETSGETLLHLLVNYGERFCSPQTIQAIYMLVCKDIDIDAQDNLGETGLHKVMRKKGAYRIMMALVRCGIDTTIKNNENQTAEDVLLVERPEGWEEMQHWYNKYKPGLWTALSMPNPDRKLVERLLKNWCRLTCVKNGKVVSLKSLVKDDIHKIDLLHMIEDYENANEMALALQAGFGFIVKSWMSADVELMKNVDANSKDHSYQHAYPDYPEVPRPLLAAAWETNSYDTVDVLMNLKPDTRVLYTNTSESECPPKPLFFQLVCGNTIPADERIVLRILKASDLQARDPDGQTILHVAIKYDQPEKLFNTLMTYGADLAARDCQGRTARDLAVKLGKLNYSKCIDEFVIKLVKDKKFEDIERLILHCYDNLLDITDSANRTMVDIAKKFGNRQIYEVVKLSAAIQAYVRRVYQTVDDGQLEELKRLLSCRKYHNVRDKCGRTLLHKALLRRQKDITLFLTEENTQSLLQGDTLDRTPLHYAYIMGSDEEVIATMIKQGSETNRKDSRGMTPAAYKPEACDTQRLAKFKREVTDLDLNIYLSENDFDTSFKTAIQKGDLETVKSLVSGLRGFGDISRYNNTLFDCVDQEQADIAKHLIMMGFKTDIYKQYTKCDPNDPMCAMMECGHSPTSLRERALEKKYDDLVKVIDGIANGKVKIQKQEQNGLATYGI